MEKAVISLLLALVVGGAAVGGIYVYNNSGAGNEDVLRAIGQVREDIEATREAVAAMQGRFSRLESGQKTLGDTIRTQSSLAVRTDSPEAPSGEAAAPGSTDMRNYVLAMIAEERKIREEERQREREEADKLREQRRAEAEELSQGPYDRYNLKVNSMAKVLAMSDAQRDQYFEVSKKYSDKMQELRQQMFSRRGGQGGDPQADTGAAPGGRGRMSQENRDQIRAAFDTVQKEYSAEVEAMLTASQLEVYNQLSDSSRSAMSMGMAGLPGEDTGGGPGGRFGGGVPNVGGNRGGRGGGRGGR